jgi:4-amino-4-deoxy-L-arabinose transferase-like glycosyltransferase
MPTIVNVPVTPGSSRQERLATGFVLALILTLAALPLAGHFEPAYHGVDQNGYMVTARRLLLTGDPGKPLRTPDAFLGGNWVIADSGIGYAKYPIGYPLLCSAAAKLTGRMDAMFWVNPLLAVLTVLGVFLLGRAWWGAFAGALAAILLAVNPLHLNFGLSALSHAGSSCLGVWSMLALWHWRRTGHAASALAAGALAGYAVSIRYTDALLFLPAAAMLVDRWRERRAAGAPLADSATLRGAVLLAAGAFLAVLPLLAQHWTAYGSPFRTGYGLCGESTGFGWNWFHDNIWVMLAKMDNGGLILLFPLGLAGLLHLALQNRSEGALLAWWTVPQLLLYSAYYWAPAGDGFGYTRFFISVFPPLILAAVHLLVVPLGKHPRWTWAAGALVLLAAAANLHEALRQVGQLRATLITAEAATAVAQRHLPPNATLFASKRVLDVLEFAGDWTLFATENFDRRPVANTLKPLAQDGPHPFQRRKAQELKERRGGWSDDQFNQALRDLVTAEQNTGRPVFWALPADQLNKAARNRLGGAFKLTPVAGWLELRRNDDDNQRYTDWLLLAIRRPDAGPPSKLSPAEQLLLFQEQFRSLRVELEDRVPGIKPRLDRLLELNNEIRRLQGVARKNAAPPKPAGHPAPRPKPAAGNKVPP